MSDFRMLPSCWLLFSAVLLLGGCRAARESGVVRFDDAFAENGSAWTLRNYKDRLLTSFGEHFGEHCFHLVLTNEGCTTPWKLDTGFMLTSRRFAVSSGKDFVLGIRSRGPYQMNLARGAQEPLVKWYGADGKPAAADLHYTFTVLSNRWFVSRIVGRVPDGATAAEILIGADEPNVRTRQYLAISRVTFTEYPDGGVPEDPEPRPVEIFGPPITSEELSISDRLIDEGGFLVLDGRRFFPIGVYGFWKHDVNGFSFDKGLKELKTAGFNTVQTYRTTRGRDFAELLDAVDANGMRIFISPGTAGDFHAGAETNIVAEKGRKCILSWYLSDDTSQHTTPVRLREDHLRCHQLDPNRVTSQADGVGPEYTSKYAPFLDSTDVFLPEIYPVRTVVADGSEVAEVATDMETIRRDLRKNPGRRKSVWPIIQHFDGWKVWKRFPTSDELRAMSYSAIIHGARGIVWYTYYGYGADPKARGRGARAIPERWRELSVVSREIADLLPDLTTDDAVEQPVVSVLSGPAVGAKGRPPVSALLKEGVGGRLVLAVNDSTNTVRSAIRVAGFKGAATMFENGREIAAGDELVDDFAPYAVHVYRLK